MNPSDHNRLHIITSSRPRIDRKVVLFLFFLFLSAFFWLLLALGKDYTTSIKTRLRFTGLPEHLTMLNGDPYSLRLSVSGRGYTLLWQQLFHSDVYAVNLKGIQLHQSENDIFWFLSKDILNGINKKISNDLILNISGPDTIFLTLTEKISRKIPVKPDIRVSFAQQYMLCEPFQCKPDTILVTGAKRILDTLSYIQTSPVEKKNLNKSLNNVIPLKGSSRIQLVPPSVAIIMHVSKFTETSLRVPLKTINVPDGILLKTFPSEVTLSFRVCLDKYKAIQPDLFKVAVDFHDIKGNKSETIPVRMLHQPDFIEGLKVTPANVEFILER